jgi:ABC-type arginine transport system ATPase subunit
VFSITTSGLTKRYGSVLAVADLTVEVALGVTVVVGATWYAGRRLRTLRLTSDA